MHTGVSHDVLQLPSYHIRPPRGRTRNLPPLPSTPRMQCKFISIARSRFPRFPGSLRSAKSPHLNHHPWSILGNSNATFILNPIALIVTLEKRKGKKKKRTLMTPNLRSRCDGLVNSAQREDDVSRKYFPPIYFAPSQKADPKDFHPAVTFIRCVPLSRCVRGTSVVSGH